MGRSLGQRGRVAAGAAARLAAATLIAAAAACAGGSRRPAARPPVNPNVATAAELQGQQPQVGRVEELFRGRFPGVQAYATQGGMLIKVRGISSFTSDGQPLYVLDGQPLAPNPDGIVAVNPNDVARIEVLKDAADLAAWGSRGGNGVVRITTKKPGRP